MNGANQPTREEEGRKGEGVENRAEAMEGGLGGGGGVRAEQVRAEQSRVG